MASIEEQLTDQFYEWETRGRGWQVWDAPVSIEPPFQPFYGHYLRREPAMDDGSRPTFLSSLVETLRKQLANEAEAESPVEEEEPEPDLLERDSLIEIHASLPAALTVSKEAFEQFITNLSTCREPVSFELIGTENAIVAQLTTSEQDARRVQQQLEAYFPEAVFTQNTDTLENAWRATADDEIAMVEFGLSEEFVLPINTSRSLNLDPFIGIAAALSDLQPEELGLFQVIFQPVRHAWGESILRAVSNHEGRHFFVNRPELLDEAKKKVSRPLFAAVVRMAIKTSSKSRTMEIAKSLAGAMNVYANPNGNHLIPLENNTYPSAAHEEDVLRRQSHRLGMILNTDELLSLVHLPSSSVRAPKLKREGRKSKSAPKTVLNPAGLLLGENHHAGKVNQVWLATEQRASHAYVIGASGTGKSTFLCNLIHQDIERGQGVAVLDPHGDLIDRICGSIPVERIKDVVVLDPSDEEFSIGFNILSAHSDMEKNLLSSDLVSVFQRLSTSWGDQMGSVFQNAILAFLESGKGGTLSDLRRFLIEPAFRNQFLETVNDPDVVYYWRKAFPALSGNKSIGSVLTRLDTFLSPKPIRYMVSQKENRLDFADIMNSGKIFLAKLSQGTIGKENSYLMGSLLVAKFHQAAMSRANMAESDRRNFWLYIDEFHNFITPSMAEILSGARKYRIGLILAHQELRQLQRDAEVASAVFTNPYARICFRVGDDDARKLSDGFGFFDAKDLQSLPNYEAICRVERADCDFNLSFPPPAKPDATQAVERRKAVITASRERYAVSRQQIEAERKAQAASEEPTEKPKKNKTEAKVTETELPKAAPVETPPVPAPPPPKVESAPIVSKAAEPQPPTFEEIIKQKPPELEQKSSPKPDAPVPDMGRGGADHKSLQMQIKAVAESLGYLASIEGKDADVDLKKAGRRIACEILVTTSIGFEVDKLPARLKAGFQHIAMICRDTGRLTEMRDAVNKKFSEHASVVGYYTPDQFIAYLQQLNLQEPSPAGASKEKTIAGRKVTREFVELTDEEAKKRREAKLQQLKDMLKKKNQKKKKPPEQ